MRILSVQFKNLNSLKGTWKIDFTDPAYVSDGIFAITGPTGAGKTTILDAICLALYGQTPRLARITGADNQLMSKHTGDCFAEVVFQVSNPQGEAKIYRCNWSQHRAHGKADGKLQNILHNLYDGESEESLPTDGSTVAEITKLTKLGFDEFTRAVMLAQGEFSAFLKADDKQRAKILEQITNTTKYTKVSQKVYEKFSEAKQSKEAKAAAMGGIKLLDEAAIKEIESAIAQIQEDLAKLQSELIKNNDLIGWLDKIKGLEENLAKLQEERAELDAARAAFVPQRQQLDKARAAATINQFYETTKSQRDSLKNARIKLEKAETEKSRLETALTEAREKADKARASQDQTTANREQGRALIERVRRLDDQIKSEAQRLATVRDDLAKVKSKHDGAQKVIAAHAELQGKLSKNLEEHQNYLDTNSVDASLAGELSAITQTTANLKNLLNERKDLHERLKNAQEKHKKAQAASKELEETKNKAVEEQTKWRERLKRIENALASLQQGQPDLDLRDERTNLVKTETMFESTAVKLEQLRSTREDLTQKEKDYQTKVTLLRQEEESLKSALIEKAKWDTRVASLTTERTTLSAIRDMEEERKKLHKDAPCPLCGSTVHPWADPDAVPAMNQIEQLLQEANGKARELASTVRQLELACNTMEFQINTLKDQIQQLKASAGDSAQWWQITCKEQHWDVALSAVGEGADWTLSLTSAKDFLDKQLEVTQKRINECSQLIKKQNALRQEEQDARRGENAAGNIAAEAEKRLQTGKAALEEAGRHEQLAAHSLDTTQRLLEDSRNLLIQQLTPFGAYLEREMGDLGGDVAERLNNILAGIEKRKQLWEQANSALNTLKKQRDESKQAQEIEQTRVDEWRNQIGALTKEHTAKADALDTLKKERQDQFGDRSTDEEEKKLIQACQKAEEALKQAEAESNNANTAVLDLAATIKATESNIAEQAPILEQAEANLKAHFEDKGFADEASFLSCLLEPKALHKLEEQAAHLDNEEKRLNTLLLDKANALEEERQKSLTTSSGEELGTLVKELTTKQEEQREELGAKREQLLQNEKTKELYHTENLELERLTHEFTRWERLNRLIGSADGTKLQRLVYGLTLGVVLRNANDQLTQLHNRYTLKHGGQQNTEFQIIDHNQSDVERPVKTLSGGESFIVSLALALGLSRMASKSVRIDTLFLDEGFGTLDEETLDSALNTLASLKQDGKIIGIISHVAALRDRIHTRIQVTPKSNGLSVIKGPGCTQPKPD